MKMTILFFGSFNPVHRGHLAIVRRVVEQWPGDEVWVVVSPGNPLKDAEQLAPAEHRLEMVRLAVEAAGLGERVKVCDVEFSMPRPSYTIDTLERLQSEYPDRRFSLLVGSDIIGGLERWKDYRKLLDNYPLLVYPRPGYPVEGPLARRVKVLEGLPVWNCSSTEVRKEIAEGRAAEMLTPEVANYIKQHNLWTRNSLNKR